MGVIPEIEPTDQVRPDETKLHLVTPEADSHVEIPEDYLQYMQPYLEAYGVPTTELVLKALDEFYANHGEDVTKFKNAQRHSQAISN